ncbi:MAG: hypothetical protein HZB26_21585 [Candidatus Hydrogenedentes bacterium]|nr:hypothetical protein [Candidatus Hydrogenedentota bacterium]
MAFARLAMTTALLCGALGGTAVADDKFEGTYFRGRGDTEYFQLLEYARQSFSPNAEFQNISMLYNPTWNGFVEGPTWGAWWIQNSYGPTYCALPFYQEPYVTFLQNAQDLWFDQMGDGKHAGDKGYVAPDGCLCDAAAPGVIYYRQGDGKVDIHDWGMEFTAAGVVMQSELLLISRDAKAIAHYLPRLERSANFIESRRDPKNNLFLAGPAGNLLAPSYAGYLKPDGTYDKAYLTGLSVTYIAALDRLIELEKLSKAPDKVTLYTERRDAAKKGLANVTTDEGYFVRSLDPDGTKHGVFGAAKHGYFEASPNHDAIALRVVDDVQAAKIFAKIEAIPQLRPHAFIIPNYPSYDDMYEKLESIWKFGTWVNGGHWSTCEARMMLAYSRMGKYDDARKSMKQLLTFARRFRMDNPLTDFGNDVYQPKEPINICYDTFGPAAGLIRGLFEYLYRADGLTVVPHIPPTITRFGAKKLCLQTSGAGAITSVLVNGQDWSDHDAQSVHLAYDKTPDLAQISIGLGGAKARTEQIALPVATPRSVTGPAAPALDAVDAKAKRIRAFYDKLASAGLSETYEAAHARLAIDCVATAHERAAKLASGALKPLPDAASEAAADKSYADTAAKLCDGLEKAISGYASSTDDAKKRILALWNTGADSAAR